jgi:hypothetical protein
MKAKLEFDLDDPSDRKEHIRAVKATQAYICLHDIAEDLRNIKKYDIKIKPGEKWALPDGYHTLSERDSELLWHFADHIQALFYKILEDRGVNLDELD